MLGPVIGGAMNSKLGFLPCYMIFSAIIVVVGITTAILLPSSLNDKPVVTENEF